MGSDIGDWAPSHDLDGNRGGSPSHSSDRSDRSRSPSQTSDRSHRSRSPSQTSDRSDRSQSEETGDRSSRSPARDRNLRGLGINPREWSDQQASTSSISHSEIERERLSKMQAVKDWIESSIGSVFENTHPEDLPEELATAKSLGVKPLHVDDPGFSKVANEEDTSLKWVVTESGDLLFVPHSVGGEEIAHTVLTQGGPVVAAGEAVIVVDGNERLCIEITNHCGHYRPDESSLEIGIQAFKAFGMTFLGETKESDSGDSDGNIGGHDGHNGGDGDGHHSGHDGDRDTDAKELSEAKKAFVEVLTERASRIQEVEKAVELAQAEPNDNKAHHVFDNPEHLWDLTGLDQHGNWDLIRTTLLNNYGDVIADIKFPYEVSEPFGDYKVTVKGKVVDGAVRISDAWVNPL